MGLYVYMTAVKYVKTFWNKYKLLVVIYKIIHLIEVKNIFIKLLYFYVTDINVHYEVAYNQINIKTFASKHLLFCKKRN